MVTLLTILLACGQAPTELTDDSIPEMAPTALLTRLSLDLRGRRPSPDELARVEADPAALDPLLDEMMADPAFGGQVRALYAEIYRTQTEAYYVSANSYGITDSAAFLAAVGDEPLRILSTVAEEDLPWTTLVTADWTMANEVLAQAWPLDYSGEGWQKAKYNDGRPAAGILSTNAMWWRYVSTDFNANRARANAVSRIFLCNDYLSRPIDFDRNVNLLDQEAVEEALQTNPACVNCHQSLDPLASYFWGFYYYNYTDADEARVYHPERELLYRTYTGISPSYFGEPGFTLGDLGRQLASDNRYVECAVEQVYEGLLRRDSALADQETLTAHREAFLAGELTLRSLIRSVVNDPYYRSGDTEAEGAIPKKMVTPTLLASQIEALTGYRMSIAGFDLMTTDTYGLRTLAGGADGFNVTKSATAPNTTLVLVQERLAEAAAWYAVTRDLEGAVGEGQLLTIDPAATPETDRAAMVTQIQTLHRLIYGTAIAADGEEVTANLELWADLYAVERDTVDAWAGLVAVLLRDPDLLFY